MIPGPFHHGIAVFVIWLVALAIVWIVAAHAISVYLELREARREIARLRERIDSLLDPPQMWGDG